MYGYSALSILWVADLLKYTKIIVRYSGAFQRSGKGNEDPQRAQSVYKKKLLQKESVQKWLKTKIPIVRSTNLNSIQALKVTLTAQIKLTKRMTVTEHRESVADGVGSMQKTCVKHVLRRRCKIYALKIGKRGFNCKIACRVSNRRTYNDLSWTEIWTFNRP